jgi:hypothetical protein
MGVPGVGETGGQSYKLTEVTDSDNYSYLRLVFSLQLLSIVANRLCIKMLF